MNFLWKKRKVILPLLLVFICFFGYLAMDYISRHINKFNDSALSDIYILSDANDIKTGLWEKEETEEFYCFLPSFYNIDECKMIIPDTMSVVIGDNTYYNGSCLSEVELDCRYKIKVYINNKQVSDEHLTFLQGNCANTVYISTLYNNINLINNDEDAKQSGSLSVYSTDGSQSFDSEFAYITGHGNSTWEYDKKAYNLKFNDTVDICGIGAYDEWVLLANYLDDTKIRNKMIYDFAEECGLECAMRSEMIDLYIDGEYYGLYQIVPKVRAVMKNEISSNSFLFTLNIPERYEQNALSYITDNGQYVEIIDLFGNGINSISKQKEIINNLDYALADYENNPNSIYQFIDMSSWCRKYLIEEIFQNQDAGALSQYFYTKNESNIVYAGPVWDYDLSCGNINGDLSIQNPKCFLANRMYKSSDISTFWYANFYSNKNALNMIVDEYNSMRSMLSDLIDNKIDAYFDEIRCSLYEDSIRWYSETYDVNQSYKYLKDYLTQRISFLDIAWIDKKNYCTICIDKKGTLSEYLYYTFFEDEDIVILDRFKSGYIFTGWYSDSDCTVKVNVNNLKHENITLYAGWKPATEWNIKDLISTNNLYACLFALMALVVLTLLFYSAVRIWRQRRRMQD